MDNIQNLITDNLHIWSTALDEKKSGRGRGGANKDKIYGIKKLRELILDLAVRGKLIPQDPNDEPASELLKRIDAEKQNLIKEGKIKKEKPLAPISKEEKPYDLPNGWEWVRVINVGYSLGQKTPSHIFTYVDVSSIDNLNGTICSPEVLEANSAPSRARKIVKSGTVIYSTVRPYLLNVAVVVKDFDPEAIASTAFAIIHPFSCVVNYFVYHCLRSPYFVKYVENTQIGIAYPAINDAQFFSGLIPLPPLAEQHRIVAKVDELMKLCDALEAGIIKSYDVHGQLVETLLNGLCNAQNNDDFNSTWRIIYNNFETLFTTEESIEKLKQSILQLAIMGKLVPQDPNDEPASELLKRIATEKQKLITEGKLKKEKPLPPITDTEKPFDLPKGWEWVRLGNLTKIISGFGFDSEDFNEVSGAKVIKITNAGVGNFIESESFLPEHFVKKYSDYLSFENDIIIALTRPYIADGLKVSKCPNSYTGALINQRVAAIRNLIPQVGEFTFEYLRSELVLNHYKLRFTDNGLQPNLKTSDISELYFPLPSLGEQNRIVFKIRELMALCNELKSKITLANQTKITLANTISQNIGG